MGNRDELYDDFSRMCKEESNLKQSWKKNPAPVISVFFDSNKQPESFPLEAMFYKPLSGFFSCFLYKFPF